MILVLTLFVVFLIVTSNVQRRCRKSMNKKEKVGTKENPLGNYKGCEVQMVQTYHKQVC